MHRFLLEEAGSNALRNLRAQAGSRGALRVLIVDDEEGFCWTLKKVLESLNYTVLSAQTANQALSHLESEPEIGLALIDMRLSNAEETGDLSLLRRMKALRPHLPVVVMSAFGTPELKRDAREQGALAFLDKPFRVEKLLRLIREAASDSMALKGNNQEFASP
jgi:DNA-binding NtrC family response regulator